MAGRDFSVLSLPADHAGWLEVLRTLLAGYEEGLGFDLGYQGFAEELASLPGEYAPRAGLMLLAVDGEVTIENPPVDAERALGCVLLRPLRQPQHAVIRTGDCEMKRLLVPKRSRRRGVGEQLVRELVREAGRIGYTRMLLDTDPALVPAIRLYKRCGFQYAPRYNDDPYAITIYMQRVL